MGENVRHDEVHASPPSVVRVPVPSPELRAQVGIHGLFNLRRRPAGAGTKVDEGVGIYGLAEDAA